MPEKADSVSALRDERGQFVSTKECQIHYARNLAARERSGEDYRQRHNLASRKWYWRRKGVAA